MINPFNIINNIFKSNNQKEIDRLKNTIININSKEADIKKITQKDFEIKTSELKDKIKKGESLDTILPEAFALVREAAYRTLNERHFDVQLMGGIILHEGKISEMKTGEGKTLVSTLAAYLNSLTGKGVHIVTVNDYLAKRDSEWMGKIYNYLGLSVGCILSDLDNLDRKKNYNCDITYGTNSEFGFDYLRDQMNFSLSEMVQRDHNFCIVDEVDSILIDEARTPLVISGPAEDKSGEYKIIDKLCKKLKPDDYEVDEKDKNILLTNKGIDNIENIFSSAGVLKNNNFYDPENLSLVHHVNQALKANHLFSLGKDYIVNNNAVKIIDEFTGRVLEGRRYSDGLHQALEAKENINIQPENQTLATVTYQNYFRLYKKLSGMTGTALTESEEFYDIYSLPVVTIPTHRKMIREDYNDQIFRTEDEKNNSIVNKIIECNKKGQPVLVGTTSINKSELYSNLLKKKNIKHSVLNAKQHEKEASIIEDAGKLNAVTIATNMAGRGTDIKLGGKKIINSENEIFEEKIKVKKSGGLFVIGTERHESRRIDNQLRGRSGRQGDEGNSIFYISLEDDLMRIFGSESMNGILKKLGLKENESIDHPWINKALERAQQKVEARNYDIRKTLLKFDDVMNDQRQVIFSQRKEVLKKNSIYELTNIFLEEIISALINEKKEIEKNPKSKNLQTKINSLLGKAIEDNEIKNLIISDNENFKKIINEKFLEKRLERERTIGNKDNTEIEKKIFIQTLDMNWRSHLQYLEQLRQVIGLRSYGQKDPLNEYKKEAFNLFEDLLEKIKVDVMTILFNLTILEKPKENLEEGRSKEIKKTIVNNPNCLLFQKKNQKISRNDKCQATGKKYKYCCGSL